MASWLFLISLIYYVIAKRSEGRNYKAAKILLAISSALGVAGALSAMASVKALHEVNILLGQHGVVEDGLSIKTGSWEGVGLCVAAGIHFLIVLYASFGMPGTPNLSGLATGYIGRRF